MDWQTLLVIIAAFAAVVVWKKLGLVGEKTARQLLQQGARVIDVRTPEEFGRDHLPGAVNVPLGELDGRIGQVAPDKDQPLLLHCLSGGRSGIAARRLKSLGYTRVFNLGGLARARKLVGPPAA